MFEGFWSLLVWPSPKTQLQLSTLMAPAGVAVKVTVKGMAPDPGAPVKVTVGEVFWKTRM
jgi:hypothetical protein